MADEARPLGAAVAFLVVALAAAGCEGSVSSNPMVSSDALRNSCGNLRCNPHETCENCPADCGECTPPAPPPNEPPAAITGDATSVTDTTAALNGTVDPNRQATTASFEYGTTTAYGNTTPDQDVGSGDAATTISADLSGLTAATTYHYRVKATNAAGTTLGEDQTFATPAAPPPPPTCTADVVLTPAPGELEAAAVTARAEHKLNKSVCVVLQAGATYRETFILPFESGLTLAPITLDLNGATITGADVFPLTPDGNGRLTAVWPHDLGNDADPWPWLNYDRVILNREAAFINHGGAERGYVVVDDPAELVDGTLYVDEAANLATIDPYPVHETATSAEITVRPLNRSHSNAFGRGLVFLDGRKNVTVTNGTLERANGSVREGVGGGVNGGPGANWTFENLTIRENAGGGLGTCCSDGITYRNIDHIRNGIGSLGGFRLNGVLVANAYETGTNWRGAWPTPGFPGGFTGWSVGSKFLHVHDMTVNGVVALSNYTHGFWIDSDGENIVVNDLVSAGNMRGVYTEANQGPITYNRPLVCNNRYGGMGIARSDNVTINDARLFDNRGGQIYFDGAPGGIDPDGSGPHGIIYGNNFTLRNSRVSSVDNRGGPSGFLAGKNWLVFLGNRADDYGPASDFDASDLWEGNTWWHGDAARVAEGVFHMSSTSFFGGFADFPEWSLEVDNTDTWASSNPNAGVTCPAPLPPAGYTLPDGW
jgi:hypothetical protein